MNWQSWKVWALSIGMIVAASQAACAHNGQPSQSELQQMGLGGMTIMSDDEAMAVRGLGFNGGGSSAKASGNSFATINLGPFAGAHSENSYSSSGKHKASGDNFSFAGVAVITTSDKSGHGGDQGGGKPGMGGNGGYGGSGPPMGSGNGGYPPSGGMGGNNPPPSHGNNGGGYGGMGGGKTTITAFVVFAGGFSHSSAH